MNTTSKRSANHRAIIGHLLRSTAQEAIRHGMVRGEIAYVRPHLWADHRSGMKFGGQQEVRT
jgi:hypothetical protein